MAEHKPEASTILDKLNNWGKSSLPPSLLATLILPLHSSPLRLLPLSIFLPPLLFSSYLNLQGYTTGSAGITAAFSGLYALLSLRKRGVATASLTRGGSAAQSSSGRLAGLRRSFSPRGAVRATAVGLGTANAVAGGWVYATGSFDRDERERVRRNRWSE